MTTKPQADVGPAVELQVEVAAFCEVVKARCDKRNFNHPLQDLRDEMVNWMGNHLMYVMAIRDEYIALKTTLMQICREATN